MDELKQAQAAYDAALQKSNDAAAALEAAKASSEKADADVPAAAAALRDALEKTFSIPPSAAK